MFIIQWFFEIFFFLLMAKIIMSWLIRFDVLNINQPQVRKIWEILVRIFEPIFKQIRRVVPVMGGMDFSPVVVLVIMMVVRRLLLQL